MSKCALLDLELIDDLRSLKAMQAEWSALVHDLPNSTPFQMPQWLLTWWSHFGSGTIRVYAFRNPTGSLVGILPAFQHSWQNKRQLTLIGSGISDYLEPALSSTYAEVITDCLSKYLAAHDDWDVCDWQDLNADTPLSALSRDAHLSITQQPDGPCSAIDIAGEFADFWSRRPGGLKRNVRRYRQKAEQTASLQTSVYEDLNEECLEALIRLHALRWREQGEPGMIAANRSAAFLRDVVSELAVLGMLRLLELRYDGQIAAAILAFPFRNVLYAYLSGFDPAYASFGFGSLLLRDALQYAFSRQYQSWNFLRGDESYKFDFGARRIAKSRLIISPVRNP